MKKLLTLAAVLAPLALGACGHDKTVVVQPPGQSSGTNTVVTPAAPAPSVTKVCPAGAVTC
jgi:hypothetical protein